MKLIIDIPDTVYEAYKEWHKQGVSNVEQSLIALAMPYEERPQSDLISREALKKDIMAYKTMPEIRKAICEVIDNAPTVEYPFYAEAYQTGFEEAKVIIILSIAEQYTAHNELVPIWLSIGDIKGGAE